MLWVPTNLEPWRAVLTNKTVCKVFGGGKQGFSLLELMLVIAIVAVLAFSVTTIYMNPVIDVKGAIFSLRADLGFARGEAVRRNQPVLIQFDMGAVDGYRLCVQDPDPANAANFDNDCDDPTDEVIRQEVWDEVVQFYNQTTNAPAGPNVVPLLVTAAVPVWPNPLAVDQDGVTFPQDDSDLCDCVQFFPDGTTSSNGEIYLYAPSDTDGPSRLKTPPYGLVVSQIGSVQIGFWRPGDGWVQK